MTATIHIDANGVVTLTLTANGREPMIVNVPNALCQLWDITGAIGYSLPGVNGKIGCELRAAFVRGRTIAIEL
jgi:hypothetical protein